MKTKAVRTAALLALLAFVVTACANRRVDEEPILDNGDRVEVPDGDPRPGASPGEGQAELQERRQAVRAAALASCQGEACDAIVRGEVRPGLSETGVLAATGTTSEAWHIRRSEGAVVMSPRSLVDPPSDAAGDLYMVQIADGAVTRYAYRESQGVRLVDEASDATTEGRGRALADMLVREGDDLAAVGEFDAALDRYDRADVLSPGDAMISYKIATTLDKQLRPIEALIQYRLFLHELELEKIRARGEVAASVAEAIAHARDRIIVLERRSGD
jgi:tetratricopeptide (TPR) repeat protein